MGPAGRLSRGGAELCRRPLAARQADGAWSAAPAPQIAQGSLNQLIACRVSLAPLLAFTRPGFGLDFRITFLVTRNVSPIISLPPHAQYVVCRPTGRRWG